ncbi:MAG: D-tyrosyl-tRNA(Tyr) deacylase [Clostridia bacterium]|jgi:D-tyrosyl-tRNA(Tyr) deacylase|nr:D-tyrosyl-tRNA(Tyr) deacylase [Clostridia bacterium]
MKAVVQRVLKANLKVDGKLISEIGKGMVIFFGVGKGDEKSSLEKMAKKLSNLRIFEDENGKMNLSVKDIGGQILLVSQFTLFADCSHGNRPSFFDAEVPERANEFYLEMEKLLKNENIIVKMGVFGADMKIEVLNDGPVTIMMDSQFI